jgi:hypothetical protein
VQVATEPAALVAPHAVDRAGIILIEDGDDTPRAATVLPVDGTAKLDALAAKINVGWLGGLVVGLRRALVRQAVNSRPRCLALSRRARALGEASQGIEAATIGVGHAERGSTAPAKIPLLEAAPDCGSSLLVHSRPPHGELLGRRCVF